MGPATFLQSLGTAAVCWASIWAAVDATAQEHVQFPSTDSVLTGGAPTRLDGYIYRPTGDGPFPAVVAMHSCAGLFDPRLMKLAERTTQWGTHLANLGYLVLFPDSFNPRGFPEICRHDPTVARPAVHRIHDAYGALAYLQKQLSVRQNAVALLGWSHGGVTTVWASHRATRARPKELGTDFKLGIALYPGCDAILKVGYVPALPLHLLVGDLDDWTPAAPCKEFARRAGLDLVAYPNAGHAFDAPNQSKLILTGLRSPSGTATIGTDPEARADVFKRVPAILATMKGR